MSIAGDSRIRIAVVDDDEDVLELIRSWIERAGFCCDVFRGGGDFVNVDSPKLARYDCIILDWSMPGLSGIDLLKWIRRQSFAATPVMFLTHKASAQAIVTGLDAGADEYVLKSATESELIARLSALLRRSTPGRRRLQSQSNSPLAANLDEYFLSLARLDMFDSVIEQAPVGIVMTDTDGYVVHVNRYAQDLFGSDYVGENINNGRESDAMHPDVDGSKRDSAGSPLIQVFNHGEEVSRSGWMTDANNQKRYMDTSARPIRDATGTMLGAVATYVDSTEISRALSEQHQQSRVLNVILDEVPAEWRYVDHTGALLYQSRSLSELLESAGSSDQNVFEMDYRILDHGTETAIGKEEWPILRALKGVHVRDELYDVPVSSGVRSYQISSSPVLGLNEEVIGAVSILIDVTEQTRTESVRGLLENVVSSPSSAIMAFDKDDQIAFLNGPAKALLKLTDPVYPLGFEAHFLLESVDEFGNVLPLNVNPIERLKTHEGLDADYYRMVSSHQNEARYFLLNGRGTGETNQAIQAVLVLDDVTQEVARRIERTRTSRLEGLGHLTGGIAHDFNNLLSVILGAVQLAEHSGVSEKVQRHLGVAHDALSRAEQLTQRLLAFASTTPSLVTAVDVRQVIEDVIQLTDATNLNERASVEIDCEPGLLVQCERSQLENALLNLILNAGDAIGDTENPGRITVAAKRTDAEDFESSIGGMSEAVTLSVLDNGAGMSAETLDKALDPFFTTKDALHGTGLGLSMVYAFVQQSNGSLDIQSSIDKGTAVTLELPAATGLGMEINPPMLPSSAEMGHGQQILVVEDEPELAQVIRDLIYSLGYSPVLVRSGEQALDVFSGTVKIEAIITDVVMPVMDGYELARKVRQLDRDLPIIYLSGFAKQADSTEPVEAGIFVRKPVTRETLAKALDSVLRVPSELQVAT